MGSRITGHHGENNLSHMVELKVSYRMLRSEGAAWGAGESSALEKLGWKRRREVGRQGTRHRVVFLGERSEHTG